MHGLSAVLNFRLDIGSLSPPITKYWACNNNSRLTSQLLGKYFTDKARPKGESSGYQFLYWALSRKQQLRVQRQRQPWHAPWRQLCGQKRLNVLEVCWSSLGWESWQQSAPAQLRLLRPPSLDDSPASCGSFDSDPSIFIPRWGL